MSDAQAKSERGKSADVRVVSAPQPAARVLAKPRIRIVPLLITFAAMGVGDALDPGRDGARPEVAGRIVELPVADNQFVAKGELLMVIDPTNYQIAVELADAAVQQAQANQISSLEEDGLGRAAHQPNGAPP